MKKFMSILLAAVMTVGLFAGCGSKKESTAANRLEAIKERGYIEVATEPYFSPYEFIDSRKEGDEQYVGSDILLAQRIADELGVELKIIPLEFSAVLSSITEGKYDLALSALAYTPERAESMELTDAYYTSGDSLGYSLLIREEDLGKYQTMDDFDGTTVVCQSGSIQEAYATSQMDVDAMKELVRVSATTDGYLMVQEGKADACVCDVANAQLYCEQNEGLTTLYGVIQFESDPAYDGVRGGIPKGETELLEFVNGVIADVVESGEFLQWHEEYREIAKELGLE